MMSGLKMTYLSIDKTIKSQSLTTVSTESSPSAGDESTLSGDQLFNSIPQAIVSSSSS